MTVETMHQIADLYKDSKINEQIDNATSLEELVAVFNENGVTVSVEEVNELLAQAKSDELNETSLDAVAGGSVWSHIGSFVWGVIQGVCGW